MKNTFGKNIAITLFGESHGTAIGCVIDGLSAGTPIDTEFIKHRLSIRRPDGITSTSRIEADEFEFLSGVVNNTATGTPITLVIKNTSTKSKDYDNLKFVPRPSHADYAAHIKYNGFEDARGGGHFSGRITAALVAAGAIAIKVLEERGIKVMSHIKNIAGIEDRNFGDFTADAKILDNKAFGTLDSEVEEKMQQAILNAKAEGDSVGGIIETAIVGIPAGVGEPWYDTVEGVLSHAIFSIPAIKGIEFGDGFKLAEMKGSEANDAFRIVDGKVITETNSMGGINGGITNGMPILFSCAVKPTPSIYKQQKSVDLNTMQNTNLVIEGRHDPSIVARVRPVIESVAALTILDMLS